MKTLGSALHALSYGYDCLEIDHLSVAQQAKLEEEWVVKKPGGGAIAVRRPEFVGSVVIEGKKENGEWAVQQWRLRKKRVCELGWRHGALIECMPLPRQGGKAFRGEILREADSSVTASSMKQAHASANARGHERTP